ncbi:MAG: 2-enoyl thioester reductase domain-containing protein [Opitutales bacterium]|nr:2-enoyl thioester reductase domain-containing protein [Opitutales bacterium]
MRNRTILYQDRGNPLEVLSLEELPMPKPGKGEVLIQMLAATIHPSDFGLINGSYGKLRDLPAVGGREGVGKVIETGAEVDKKVIGKLVAMPDAQGAWQEFVVTQTDNLLLVPSLVPPEQLAVAILNPMTAWRLLHDFEYLKEGDFIIQNAGNSAVGLAVIQFAKMLGVPCISLVRTEERLHQMKEFGVEHVLLDDDAVPGRVLEITKGQKCALGLNSIGGRSSLRVARSLRSSGVLVTFGAMDSSPIRFPTRELIFEDIRFVGFWLDRWKSKQTPASLRNAIEHVLQPLALDQVRYPIDKIFPLEDFELALKRNMESRWGKVLLSPNPENLLEARKISS